MVEHNKTKILRIIARMNVGGPAIQVTNLMTQLDPMKFEQLLVTGYCDTDEIDYLDSASLNFPVARIDGLGRAINFTSDFKALLQLRKIINSFSPDIIHTHTAKAGFLGRIAYLTTPKKRKTVHTFHGHLLFGYFSSIKTKLVVTVEKLLATQTDVLVTVGEKVRDDLLDAKVGVKSQFRIVKPGIRIGQLPRADEARRSLGIQDDAFCILFLGRLVKIKSPERILEIAQVLTKFESNFVFLIAGGGPEYENLVKATSERNMNLKFLGWRSDVETLLSAANIVILTSQNEGTPISLIQAQLAGTPVISTKVGSAPEVVSDGKSGFILDYDPEEFARLILKLSKSKELMRELSSNALIFARNNFSVESFIANYSQIYKSLNS
jgi:glycosyltransferase involved in cell wall biosynthesis